MSLADEFRKSAYTMVEKFSLGNFTFKAVISESYDTISGEVITTYSTFYAKAVEDSIENNVLRPTLLKGSSVVITSGTHLNGNFVNVGDTVVSSQGIEYIVVGIEKDSYSAAYKFGVDIKNVGA